MAPHREQNKVEQKPHLCPHPRANCVFLHNGHKEHSPCPLPPPPGALDEDDWAPADDDDCVAEEFGINFDTWAVTDVVTDRTGVGTPFFELDASTKLKVNI